jgi:uncharacterized protein
VKVSSPTQERRNSALATVLGLLLLMLGCGLQAKEVIPALPKAYFNDYAGVVSPATADILNSQLADFERRTSSQIVVAIYPHMQSDSSIEDYTVRVAEAWKVGQKGKNNGAVLFVFTQDHRLYLQVGYGLEGDYSGGLSAGINAILAATQHEYHGTGHTRAESDRSGNSSSLGVVIFVIFFVLIVVVRGFSTTRGRMYGSQGYSSWGSGGFGGGGGWSGGGGGGGGFSSGGGSFGGGGAGGSW